MHHSKIHHTPAPETPVEIPSPAPVESLQTSSAIEQLLPSYGRDIAHDASDSADDFVEKFHTHQQGE